MSTGPGSIDPVITGRSHDSFAAAAQNAVQKWEDQRGGPPDERTTLRVIDMYVDVDNAIHDYIVVLRTGG
jgi:flavin-binding protein dodecin